MLHHEILGEDVKGSIVFLHGIGGTSRYWKSRVLPLAAEYRLILVDLLGYGLSPKPWTRYTVQRHVDELHKVLEEHGTVTLVGHSFGSIIALAYAARYPEQSNDLVLISLPYFGSKTGAMRYFSNSPPADRYVMTNLAFAAFACIMTRYVLRWLLPYVLRDMPVEVVQDLAQHTWRSYTSSVWDGIYRHNLIVDTEKLDAGCRVMLLHGELDTTAPMSGIQQLLTNYPHWQHRILAGGDHHPLLRDTQWCLKSIVSLTEGRLAIR